MHEDVECAKSLRNGLEHHGDRTLVGDVADQREMPRTVPPRAERRDRRIRLAEVGAGDPRARRGKGPRAGGADAAIGAGDEDEAILEIGHAITSPRSSM